MKQTLLIIEPQTVTQSILSELFVDFHVVFVSNASEAIESASEIQHIDAVILDLSLGGHSGLEFLYEFRTYTDWNSIPVIIYSSIALSDEVVGSRAWQQLGVSQYLYKPQTNLEQLFESVQKFILKSSPQESVNSAGTVSQKAGATSENVMPIFEAT